MRAVGDSRDPTFNESQFRLEFMNDGAIASTINLQNLYQEYCRTSRAERAAWLRRTCLGIGNQMDMPDEFEDAKPDLLPSVRTRSFLEIIQADARLNSTKAPDLPWAPLSEHLLICLVYDLPHSMRFVTQDNFQAWDVSWYQALEVARQNLDEKPASVLSAGNRLFIFASNDAYDGTRLLQKERIRGLPVEGDPIAMPVTRDCLSVAGSEDLEGLAMMAEIAEQKIGEPRPLCSVPLRLVGDDWQTWRPEPDHPHYERFHQLEMQFLAGEYEEQKAFLEKIHEKEGPDVFVATFAGVKHEAGNPRSLCTWTKGVPTWLPKTELIALYNPEEQSTLLVPWERVLAEVGSSMKSLDCYPPRWAVQSFPTADQLDRMRDSEIKLSPPNSQP